MTGNNPTRNAKTISTTTLPLLLQNFKKVFKQNVTGPIGNNLQEYKTTLKAGFLFDAVKFFYLRGVTRLSTIHCWETENNINLAYHFIAKIGKNYHDSKITIIVFLPKVNRKIKSIGKLYANALQYEQEINEKYEISFEN